MEKCFRRNAALFFSAHKDREMGNGTSCYFIVITHEFGYKIYNGNRWSLCLHYFFTTLYNYKSIKKFEIYVS